MAKIAIVYHKVDADGWCSAAIIKTAMEHKKVDFYPWSYGDPLPEIRFQEYLEIYVVDLTLPVEWMRSAIENSSLIWLDHHVEAIKKLEAQLTSSEVTQIGGYELRHDSNYLQFGACLMVASRFNMQLNLLVKLCATYDTWNRSNKLDISFQSSFEFQLGLQEFLQRTKFEPDTIVYWFVAMLHNPDEVEKLCIRGKELESERARLEDRTWLQSGTIIMSEDGFRVGIVYVPEESRIAMIAKDHLENNQVDVVYGWQFDGDDGIKISIRTPEDSPLDARELAKDFNGGGHFHAAGGYTSTGRWRSFMSWIRSGHPLK